MAIPQIPQVDREQAITDMIEALALQQAALASLMNAEAAKIDALIAAGMPAATTTAEVESFQAAVANVVQVSGERAQSMVQHLELLRAMIAESKPE